MRKELILTGIALQHAHLIDSIITAEVEAAAKQARERMRPILLKLAQELGAPQGGHFFARGPDTVLSWEEPDIKPAITDAAPSAIPEFLSNPSAPDALVGDPKTA